MSIEHRIIAQLTRRCDEDGSYYDFPSIQDVADKGPEDMWPSLKLPTTDKLLLYTHCQNKIIIDGFLWPIERSLANYARRFVISTIAGPAVTVSSDTVVLQPVKTT